MSALVHAAGTRASGRWLGGVPPTDGDIGLDVGCGVLSRAGPTHLQRRSGIFHLRMRVPDELKARVGMLEVRRSLGVYHPTTARQLASKYSARVLGVFAMAQTMVLTKDETRKLIEGCFADLSRRAEYPFVPSSSMPEMEIAEQADMATERLNDLDDQVRTGQFDGAVHQCAKGLTERRGVRFNDLHERGRQDVLEGAARAMAEQQRLFLFRLGDRLGMYTPIDSLFASPSVVTTSCDGHHAVLSMPLAPPAWAQLPTPVGPKIGELVERCHLAKKNDWAAKTAANRRRQLNYLVEHLGAETFASAVRPEDIVAFRDGIVRLRVNHHVGAGKSFVARQTDNPAHRIEPKTAALLFDTCKGFFRWAESDVHIKTNPAEKIRLLVPKKTNAAKSRKPFSANDLTAIFSAPVYRGSKALARRFEPGDHIISDAKYWVPLIGFFTGMRLGEIVQLHIGDIKLSGAIPYLDVSYNAAGEVGSGEEKHLKSEAAVRTVPLHPDLLTLGFEKFVARRAMQRKGKGRLFFEVGYGADGVPSATFSKWFGRFLDKVGLTDPALVFHSFRHTAEDAFKNGLQQQYVIDRIIGHANDAISAHYGEGVSLETMYEATKAMKLKVDILALAKAPDSC